jgi:putative ABC transport system substrate-binding protein
MGADMRRREFITLIGGAATWPLAASAQQAVMPLIGVLMNRAADDPEGQARFASFQKGLQDAGWEVGRNVRVEIRWGADDVELERKYAAELIALSPDIVLAGGTLGVTAVQIASRTVPIVFAAVTDPVGAGFVDSLSRPGGQVTGFMIYEYSLSTKWLELLKQIAPSVTRVAVLRDAVNPAGIAMFGVIQAAAQSFGLQVSPIGTQNADEVGRAIGAFAGSPNGGLIVTPSASATIHRNLIVTLAARFKLPAVYTFRYIVADGGLLSYGPDLVDQFRLAAGYVDRILKGAKPADLPVQAPTKYELVLNLKTAKTLDLIVPQTVLARADEVIE